MALRSVVLALLSIVLMVSGIGMAYVHLALPAVILGMSGFLVAVGWSGSVLLTSENADSRHPRSAERQRVQSRFDQFRHDLSLK
ncbi:conserved exported hypothetical protein [Nitrolancea hollandica Lb]|uniref:Uncharacterized protein n=1 Tax=Nitrolancea hollandica Lb TaxID=1129897 RepID=I4EJD6_9BACT|nr:conserved exported hypothetical protein [Nitrolancea hollandica Lb]